MCVDRVVCQDSMQISSQRSICKLASKMAVSLVVLRTGRQLMIWLEWFWSKDGIVPPKSEVQEVLQ